jgi:hypothetical protein
MMEGEETIKETLEEEGIENGHLRLKGNVEVTVEEAKIDK